MDKPKSFQRHVRRDGARFQIWERRGGEWEKLADNDDFREQYGPYAR